MDRVPTAVPQNGHRRRKSQILEARADWLGLLNIILISQLLGSSPIDDVVDDAILLRLCCRHDEVALYIALDPLQRLARAGAHQPVRDLTNAKNLSSVNVDIGSLTAQPTHGRLMNQDAGVRKGE